MLLDGACELILNGTNLFSFWPVTKEAVGSSSESENNDELEQITIARALLKYRSKEKMAMANPNAPIAFNKKFPIQSPRPASPQPSPATTSKILPLICQKTAPRNRLPSTAANDGLMLLPSQHYSLEGRGNRPQKFPAAGAAPYVPIRQFRTPCHGIAPPVTIRTAVPVYSAPPLPQPSMPTPQVMQSPSVRVAPPVSIRQAVPVFAAPPDCKEDSPVVQKEDPPAVTAPPQPSQLPARVETRDTTASGPQESEIVQSLEQLKIQ